MTAYQNTMNESKGNNGMDKPLLRRTIVSDFTPEALMLAHYNSPRGITILADEIMGMFNSANRYNNGQLIEQLLSAWSNSAIEVTRISNPIPYTLRIPASTWSARHRPGVCMNCSKRDMRITGCLTASCS